jgi:hypothetical protein
MNKTNFTILVILFFSITLSFNCNNINAEDIPGKTDIKTSKKETESIKTEVKYKYPEFYKGIYLNVVSGRNFKKLDRFIKLAKAAHINTFVIDAQRSRYKGCVIPKKNVDYCIKNGIHPIARIVIFPDGLKKWPVSKTFLNAKLKIAESACIKGFKEIQFDYIRFNDSSRNRHLSLKKRYAFIEGFLAKAKKHLKKYNVKTAADIFGRIPLNKKDLIGQRMEGLDEVVDIICPMAYPSHYGWSRKFYANPYYTVFITSKQARLRTKKAKIVSWIQAFRMKLSGIPYDKYIREQIRGIHDAGIKGFILWNARQVYNVPFRVTKKYYSKKKTVAIK